LVAIAGGILLHIPPELLGAVTAPEGARLAIALSALDAHASRHHGDIVRFAQGK
jgi:hypothetical protein